MHISNTRKTIRKAAKIFGKLLTVLAAAVVLAVVLIQTPAVQTRVSRYVTEKYLSGFDADITFDKISLRPFNTLVIKNISVVDRAPANERDTLFTAGWIVASFNMKGLMQMKDGKGIHIHSATVKDGFFNLVIEEKQMNNLKRMFHLKEKDEAKKSDKDVFSIDKVRLKNFAYGMQNLIPGKKPVPEGCIDWNDMWVSDIELSGEHLRFSKGVMTGEVERLSFREKSGFNCRRLSGSTGVGNGLTTIRDIRIVDEHSDVEIPLFTMKYDNVKAFRSFLDKVSLGCELNGSRIGTRTLKYFVPAFAESDVQAELFGSLEGPVSALQLRNLRVKLDGGNIDATVSGGIKGLPDIQKTSFDLNINRCSTSVHGLESTMRGITGDKSFKLGVNGLSTYAVLKGRVRGSVNDLKATADLNSGVGNLSADIKATGLMNRRKASVIGGTVKAHELDLGKILGRKILGKVSAHSGLSATLDRENGPSLKIDSLMIDKLGVNDYEYHRIAAAGNISQKLFDGRIISQDPAFNFIFQGIFSLAPKTRNSAYQFYANIGHADLHAMNFDKRESSNVRLRVNANFNRTPDGTMLGNINIGGVQLESEGQLYDIGDIGIASHSVGSRYRINFDSGFAKARYDGTRPVTEFAGALSDLTFKRELPALFGEEPEKWKGGTYDVDFQCIDPSGLTGFLKPGLYIDKNTALGLHIGSDGIAEAWMKSRRIAFKEQYIKGIDLQMDNRGDILSGNLDCEEINAAGISLQNNSLRLYANDNMTGLGLSFENEGQQLLTKGEFVARGDVTRDAGGEVGYNVSVLPSGFYFNSMEWNIMPATIDMSSRGLKINGMELTSGDQSIRVTGGMSKEESDTLAIALERFDIGVVNPFVNKGGLAIKGAATGEARITSEPGARKGILADFLIDSASVAGTRLGSVYARSLWNKDFNRYDLSLSNEIDSRASIQADALYYPATKNLEALVDLDRQDVTCLAALLTGVFSEVSGDISGRVRAEGPLDRLSISSEGTRFNNTLLTVDYTMVPYRVDGPFSIDGEGLHFDNIDMRDAQRGRGTLGGKVGWNRFRDMFLDIHIDVDNMEAINRPFKDNDGYYGRVFGTGRVDITGPLKEIGIGVDLSTTGSSRFYVPLSNTATAGTTDILKFKEPVREIQIDPYEEMMARLRNTEAVKRRNSLGVNINAHVNQSAEAFLEINKDNGSVITGRGNGDINVDFRTGRPLSLKGDYTLDEGSFHLNLMNLATRDFEINEGSSVKFNGGIMDTDLDIDAIYTTKTSISSLIGDTTSVNSRRNVNCSLQVSGKLREPKLNFGIDIPDLDPSVKARVESALSTEDKVQRQLIALLLTNSFLQDDQGGVNNNTASNTLYSNAMNLVSNQLNNILTKLGIPLDLGLKYQQNNKGNDVFDVAVSTQLFNNRVIINGNIGNRQYTNGNSNSEVAGDVDIEIKLDRSGSLRLNLFTHSADQYSNYLDNSQRSGLGIAYQREFNKVSEVFKYMFAGRKKKEQLDLEEQRRLQAEGMKTIVIE